MERRTIDSFYFEIARAPAALPGAPLLKRWPNKEIERLFSMALFEWQKAKKLPKKRGNEQNVLFAILMNSC